ncbi:MAG: hypothetical protein ACFFD1_12025 [Candidatus Thorarchaeota archaeon]
MSKVTIEQTGQTGIVRDIINGYFECRIYFTKYTNEGYEIYTREKKEFLKNLCEKFFDKHKQDLLKTMQELELQELIQKKRYIPLIYSTGVFEYPKSFVTFMDRIRDINVTSYKPIDLTDMDYYMEQLPEKYSFDQFCQGYNKRIKKIIIPLRKREVDVLTKLVDHEFLAKTLEGELRITYPHIQEIVSTLNYPKNKTKKVERALNLLTRNQIITPNRILLNPVPLGYQLMLVEGNEAKETKIFWQSMIRCETNKLLIGTNEELRGKKGIPITTWLWKTDVTGYETKNNRVFNKLGIPNFMEEYKTKLKYCSWDLTQQMSPAPTEIDIAIVKQLNVQGRLTEETDQALATVVDKETLVERLKILVSQHVWQYYPNLQYIGCHPQMAVRVSGKEIGEKIFMNIIQGLLHFPIVHLFVNEKRQEAVGYIHLPNQSIGEVIEKIMDVKERFPKIDFEYSVTEVQEPKKIFN